jgi:hypothetical protein
MESRKVNRSNYGDYVPFSGHSYTLDEVDNMSLMKSMKAILNNGHEVGGFVPRTGKDGEVIKYPCIWSPCSCWDWALTSYS